MKISFEGRAAILVALVVVAVVIIASLLVNVPWNRGGADFYAVQQHSDKKVRVVRK